MGARGWSAGHLPARLGAGMAGRRASLAVIRLVTSAFVAAGLADISAEGAHPRGELAAPCHEPGSQPADRCAIDVQGNATGHHLHVLLLQAGGGAVVTGISAGVAGFDAGLIGFVGLVSHGVSPDKSDASGTDRVARKAVMRNRARLDALTGPRARLGRRPVQRLMQLSCIGATEAVVRRNHRCARERSRPDRQLDARVALRVPMPLLRIVIGSCHWPRRLVAV